MAVRSITEFLRRPVAICEFPVCVCVWRGGGEAYPMSPTRDPPIVANIFSRHHTTKALITHRELTSDMRQSKTRTRVKLARNSIYDCHLSLVRGQMAIENSVSDGFLYLRVPIVLTFSIAAYSVWDELHEKTFYLFFTLSAK